MAMEQGNREKKQGGQELAGAKSGENAPGMEGRAPTQAVMPPMMADLSQVEKQVASMPATEVSNAQVEGKLDVPKGKGGDAGEPAGKGAAVGGGAKEEEAGGPGGAGEGAGREEKDKAETEGKEEAAQDAAGAEAAGKEGKEGEGAAPEAGAGKQGAQVDTGPLRALEGVFGADFGDVKLVIDDAKTAAAGASALVEQAGEIVLSSAEVVDGKVNPSLLAHEATHLMHLRNAQGKGGGNPSGAEAPGGDMRPSRPEDLEKEARTAATAALGGNPFEVAGRARPGSAMLSPAGTPPAGGTPAAEKKKLPSTQALKFHLADVTVNLPAREVPTGSETKVQATVGTKPDWLILNNIYLRYDGDKLKGGAATYRINPVEENRYIRLNKAGGSDLTRLNIEFDSRGKSKDPGALPAMRLRAEGLGEIEVTNIGIDKGGMKFDAKLTSKELTALASKLVGAELTGGAIDIKRANGKINVAGDSEFGVSKGGKKLLDGELKITTRGAAYEGEAKLKFSPALKIFNSVKLEGKYTVENGVEASATVGKELLKPPGGKFSFTGQVQVRYASGGESKGLSFGGGLGASLKVSDKLGFEGQAQIGFFSSMKSHLGLEGKLKGEFKPNDNLEIAGEIEAGWDIEDDQIKGKGEPSAKLFEHYTVKMPLEYDSKGTPQWKVTPTFEIDNLKLPGLDKPLEKKYEPSLPRIRIPLFGPLVIEGGPTFSLSAGLGPARIDKASLSAQIDIDKGFDFKKAELKGKLVCPFYAEAAVGFMIGLGINLVIADGGAGIEGRARATLPKDENKNAIKVDINADLTEQKGGGNALSVSSAFDLNANLEILADLNVYARYDTWFTREKIYRHTLASTKLGSYGPMGAGGKLDYNQKDGMKFSGVNWKLPEFKGPDSAWVRSKFDAIRDWF